MTSVRELEEHRAALTGHCYRMMGSIADADAAVQETMVRAWRGLERFEERSSLRTWLYRIATRVCLDALADRSRRLRPMELGPQSGLDEPLTARSRTDSIVAARSRARPEALGRLLHQARLHLRPEVHRRVGHVHDRERRGVRDAAGRGALQGLHEEASAIPRPTPRACSACPRA